MLVVEVGELELDSLEEVDVDDPGRDELSDVEVESELLGTVVVDWRPVLWLVVWLVLVPFGMPTEKYAATATTITISAITAARVVAMPGFSVCKSAVLILVLWFRAFP